MISLEDLEQLAGDHGHLDDEYSLTVLVVSVDVVHAFNRGPFSSR
jgi:hypothetical protein